MKTCKKCGSTKWRPIWRINPSSGERYESTKCRDCSNRYGRENRKQTRDWQQANKEHLREYQRSYYKDKYKGKKWYIF